MTTARLTTQQREQALELLHLFIIDGQHADEVATEGQLLLFGAIIFELSDRIHIMTSTQYGKSLFVALACIVLSCLEDELVTVLAPTDSKAAIIMGYYIQHIGDNVLFSEKLDKSTKLERLQMETTKEKIVLRKNKKTNLAGGIYILSVQGGNSQKGFEAAMGEGSRIVIGDESCLIPDTHEATMFRMMAGKKNAVYIKIGNPFYRQPPYTHFFKSYRDPHYLKIDINYHQAIQEGRYSESFINEARGKPLFSVLYENKFPDIAALDDGGYQQILSEQQLELAYLREGVELPLIGQKTMGVDLASGGANESSIAVRGDNVAKIAWHANIDDQMVVITKVVELAQQEGIPIDDDHIFFDKIGAAGTCSRMNELYPFKANGTTNDFGIVSGEKPEEDDDPTEFTIDPKTQKKISVYINRRAQMTMHAKYWIERGGKLQGKPDFDEALLIRFKVQSDKKIKIKSKEEMEDEGIESPDKWDSYMFTFAKKRQVIHKPYKQRRVDSDQFGLY